MNTNGKKKIFPLLCSFFYTWTIYWLSGLFSRLLIPNVFGEGSISCMPLTSCSLTLPALLLFFYSVYQFLQHCQRRNAITQTEGWAGEPHAVIKNLCLITHFYNSQGWHFRLLCFTSPNWLRSVPYIESSTLLLAMPAFFLLPLFLPPPSLQISTHIARQVFSCLAVGRNEPLQECWA